MSAATPNDAGEVVRYLYTSSAGCGSRIPISISSPFSTTFRPFLRQSAGRRIATTDTEGTQQKAQDALGSVQKNAEKAWETAKKACL